MTGKFKLKLTLFQMFYKIQQGLVGISLPSEVYLLWFNFILGSNFLFFCFLGMEMYDNNIIISLKQKK